MVVVY